MGTMTFKATSFCDVFNEWGDIKSKILPDESNKEAVKNTTSILLSCLDTDKAISVVCRNYDYWPSWINKVTGRIVFSNDLKTYIDAFNGLKKLTSNFQLIGGNDSYELAEHALVFKIVVMMQVSYLIRQDVKSLYNTLHRVIETGTPISGNFGAIQLNSTIGKSELSDLLKLFQKYNLLEMYEEIKANNRFRAYYNCYIADWYDDEYYQFMPKFISDINDSFNNVRLQEYTEAKQEAERRAAENEQREKKEREYKEAQQRAELKRRKEVIAEKRCLDEEPQRKFNGPRIAQKTIDFYEDPCPKSIYENYAYTCALDNDWD